MQVEARQLAQTNGRVAEVLVGGYRPADGGLRLGDLAGNLFTLVLREVPPGSRAAVRAAVAAVRATGFLNYFGLQRFGQGSVPTHVVGALRPPCAACCALSSRWVGALFSRPPHSKGAAAACTVPLPVSDAVG